MRGALVDECSLGKCSAVLFIYQQNVSGFGQCESVRRLFMLIVALI